jgi:hypothetical protein
MMELLLKTKADQEKAEADRKAAQEDLMAKLDPDRKTDKEYLMAKLDADRAQMQAFMKMMHAYQAKTDAVLPAMQVTETSRKESAAAFKPETDVNTMACQGVEARQEEEKPTSTDRKPDAAQQEEVPVEDAEVIPVGEPKKKRCRDRKLATQHRRQKTKTSTRDNCGPQKRLDVARRGSSRRAPTNRKMSRRATMARRMRDIVKKNLTQGASGFPRKRLVMADK